MTVDILSKYAFGFVVVIPDLNAAKFVSVDLIYYFEDAKAA
jgi:hypothetical protein